MLRACSWQNGILVRPIIAFNPILTCMQDGLCKLCLTDGQVVSNHLLGAALYDYCRNPGCSPIRLGDGKVFPTDRQTQDYLLCQDCEQRLNQGGEAWLSPRLATVERRFPLFDLLTKRQPAWVEKGVGIYMVADNPEIKADNLAHFAMGVFWKAAVHSWREGDRSTKIELGPYADPFRRWLLGEDQFPKNVCLQIAISPPDRAQILFIEPYEGKRSQWRSFFLYVLGVLFVIHVGRAIVDAAELCFYQNPGHPIWVSEKIDSDFEKVFVRQFRSSYKTQAFLKAKHRRDQVLSRLSSE